MITILAPTVAAAQSNTFQVTGDNRTDALPCITANGLQGAEVATLQILADDTVSPIVWHDVYDSNGIQELTAPGAGTPITVIQITRPGNYRVDKSASATSPQVTGAVFLHTVHSP